MRDNIEKNIKNPDKAEVWLSRNNPARTISGSTPDFQDLIYNSIQKNKSIFTEASKQRHYKEQSSEFMSKVLSRHQTYNSKQLQKNVQTLTQDAKEVYTSWTKVATPQRLFQSWINYSTDSTKRLLQTADVLKERGDIFIEHEKAGCPPVLDYDYEVIMDAGTFR